MANSEGSHGRLIPIQAAGGWSRRGVGLRGNDGRAIRIAGTQVVGPSAGRGVAGRDTAPPVQSAGRLLPWEEPPRTSEPVLRPPSGPKEILERYNIGESQLAGFFSGQPLGPSEEEVLGKILYHFPRFGLDNVERWRKTGITWDQVAAAPARAPGGDFSDSRPREAGRGAASCCRSWQSCWSSIIIIA